MWKIRKPELKRETGEAKALYERRRLPLGRMEFEVWSARIIGIARAAGLTADEDSCKFALADMLMHLGPAESHKEDAHFIHYLLKVAVNQVADTMRNEIRDKIKEKLKQKELGEVMPKTSSSHETKVLENGKV